MLRHGRIFREGKTAWTKLHRAWLARQRLDDPLAQEALEQLLIHLDGVEARLDALDARAAPRSPAASGGVGQVEILTRFRGISTLTALWLIAEIGDFRRARTRVVAGDHPERVLLRRAGLRGSLSSHANPSPANLLHPRSLARKSAQTQLAPRRARTRHARSFSRFIAWSRNGPLIDRSNVDPQVDQGSRRALVPIAPQRGLLELGSPRYRCR